MLHVTWGTVTNSHITVTVTGLYDTENVMKDSGIDNII